MALVVSTKQPFLVVHFRREAAEALRRHAQVADDLLVGAMRHGKLQGVSAFKQEVGSL